jgi:biotin transporter BioY
MIEILYFSIGFILGFIACSFTLISVITKKINKLKENVVMVLNNMEKNKK